MDNGGDKRDLFADLAVRRGFELKLSFEVSSAYTRFDSYGRRTKVERERVRNSRLFAYLWSD